MSHVLWLVLSIFFPSDEDVEALRQSAPSYLTTETAREHLVWARVASMESNVKPDLVLAIAWNESRYTVDAITHEIGGKISCGVMTPIPTKDKESCKDITASLANGYRAGAGHLRTWLDACRQNETCAILGYAGGYRLINACKEGPVLREYKGVEIDKCKTIPAKLLWRAKLIGKGPGPKSKTAPTKKPQS